MNHTDELKALKAAKSAAATLADTERKLREQHAALLQEREQVNGALRSLEELVGEMEQKVDAAAARWADQNAYSLVFSLNGHTELAGHGTSAGTGSGHTYERVVRPQLPHIPADRFDFNALCGVAPALVKARLTEIIRGYDKARYGLPKEERQAKLAELDAQIAEIEAAHTGLVDTAAQGGLALPLLPPVQRRREEETKRTTREAELAQARLAAGIAQ